MTRSKTLRTLVAATVAGAILGIGAAVTVAAATGSSASSTTYYACLKSGNLTKVGTKSPTCPNGYLKIW
jgi:hypothetical protein